MEETSISMTVMDTQENSIKNYPSHKDHLKLMIMINGLKKSTINGYLKKTL